MRGSYSEGPPYGNWTDMSLDKKNTIMQNGTQPDPGEKYRTRVKLTIRENGAGFFGPGIAELLERLDETGSIKEACLAMGLSYTKGRRILKRAEAALGFPLIEIRHGGAGGGASCMTDEGRAYLRQYRELEADVEAYAERRFRAACAAGDPSVNISSSARGAEERGTEERGQTAPSVNISSSARGTEER